MALKGSGVICPFSKLHFIDTAPSKARKVEYELCYLEIDLWNMSPLSN